MGSASPHTPEFWYLTLQFSAPMSRIARLVYGFIAYAVFLFAFL